MLLDLLDFTIFPHRSVPTSQQVLVFLFCTKCWPFLSSGGADDPPEGARWIENYEGLLGQEICLWPMWQEILHKKRLKTTQVQTLSETELIVCPSKIKKSLHWSESVVWNVFFDAIDAIWLWLWLCFDSTGRNRESDGNNLRFKRFWQNYYCGWEGSIME